MSGDCVVSVITIFRDAERFLAESVESVLAQSFPRWELLLVDDGSRDRGGEIARAYERAHPGRIRRLAHEAGANRGMSASRNLGIAHARGALVALLDADDVWLACRLAEQIAVFEANPRASAVYGNRVIWTSWDRSSSAAVRDVVSTHGIRADRLIPPPELFVSTYGDRRATNPGSDLTVRRDVVLRLGGFEERFRAMYEDQAFLVKLFLEEPVFVSSRCWMKYRQHADSCVARWASGGEDPDVAWKSFLAWMEAYVAGRRVADGAVAAALRTATRPYRHPWLDRIARASRTGARRVVSVGARLVGRNRAVEG